MTKTEQTYLDARQALLKEKLSTADDPCGDIKGQEHCKRAILVAAASDMPILFIGPPGHGKSMLVAAAARLDVVAIETRPCPCGEYSNPFTSCKCDADQIQKFWVHKTNLRELPIQCEVPPVPSCEMLSKRVGTTTVSQQEQLKRMGPKPTNLTEASKMFLKQALSELGMSVKQVTDATTVAAGIAALENSKDIDAQHMVEAIHYRPLRLP